MEPIQTYRLKIIHKGGYVHAVVTGSNTPENVKGYLEELLEICAGGGNRYLLIEERLQGPRLDTDEVFTIASEEAGHVHGAFTAIAYVDACASGNLMRLAETVAVNRGLPVKVFTSVAEAETWLAAAIAY